MTHDELVDAINHQIVTAPPFALGGYTKFLQALGAVVELHKPEDNYGGDVCKYCFDMAWEKTGLSMDNKQFNYPCPTIQAIEAELK
jgi:hypothetical protein